MSSQCEAILKVLQDGQSLTPLEAFSLCGTLALHSRISELRDRGHEIGCEMIEVGDKRVGCYFLHHRIAYG